MFLYELVGIIDAIELWYLKFHIIKRDYFTFYFYHDGL